MLLMLNRVHSAIFLSNFVVALCELKTPFSRSLSFKCLLYIYVCRISFKDVLIEIKLIKQFINVFVGNFQLKTQ